MFIGGVEASEIRFLKIKQWAERANNLNRPIRDKICIDKILCRVERHWNVRISVWIGQSKTR